MKKPYKLVEELEIADLEKTAIWQFVNNDAIGETAVRPVIRAPVKTLTGKVVATQVRLANESLVWALLGNIDAQNKRLTEHFLTISIEHHGKWFTLARYHDFDYPTNGPAALAAFLNLTIDQVFPIHYDIIQYAKGDPAALSGQILKEPKERLSRAEIIALAVP